MFQDLATPSWRTGAPAGPGAQRGSGLCPCPRAPQPPLLSICEDRTAALWACPSASWPRPFGPAPGHMASNSSPQVGPGPRPRPAAFHVPRPVWSHPTSDLSQNAHYAEMGMSFLGLPGPLETPGPASRWVGGPARTQGQARLGCFIQVAHLVLGSALPKSLRDKEELSFIFFSVFANSVITK